MRNKNKEKGFIKVTILIIVALIVLKYAYDIDVLDKFYNLSVTLWGKYSQIIMKVWNYLVGVVKPIVRAMGKN